MAVKDFEITEENTDEKIEKAPPQPPAQQPKEADGTVVPAEEMEVKNAQASGDGAIGRNDQEQLGAEQAPY